MRGTGWIVWIRAFILWVALLLVPTWGKSHPPTPLDKWSAQDSADKLEISIKRKSEEINRLLLLEGDIAEKKLRSAQEAWLGGLYAHAAKKLLAVTMVPGFKDHAGRAAIYQWLGISDASLGFASLARDVLLGAYAEPQQTETTRIETTTHLLNLQKTLLAAVSLKLWERRRRFAEQNKKARSP